MSIFLEKNSRVIKNLNGGVGPLWLSPVGAPGQTRSGKEWSNQTRFVHPSLVV